MKGPARLLSEDWYRLQAVIVASTAAEFSARAAGETRADRWTAMLFRGLLGMRRRAEKTDIIDPLSLPAPVRSRLRRLALASGPDFWGASANFFSVDRVARCRVAKLVAELLHHGMTPPATLRRIIREELSDLRDLTEDDSLDASLAALAKVLRGNAGPRLKLRAVTAFGEANPALLRRWRALEPALVQPLLDWVPVVVGAGRDGETANGVMMPVILDVKSAEKGGADIEGYVGNNASLEASAERARKAAVNLWKNRRQNVPRSLQAAVARARIVVDFQLITGISDQLEAVRTRAKAVVAVDGDSLQLPLALGIYPRLTGLRRTADVRASGRLGRTKYDRQHKDAGGDSLIDPVAGCGAKTLAADIQLADRMILPGAGTRRDGDALIFGAETLGGAVDLAFGGGSDGHRFVRTADLAATSKAGRYSPVETGRIHAQLTRGQRSWLDLEEEPDLVVQALMEANAGVSKIRPRSKGRYAFVRVSPTERADAAWATIWSVVDGDPRDLEEFIWARDDDTRARIFARQLTRCLPTLKRPLSSPHVLVIFGAGEPKRPLGLAGGLHAPFDIRRVLQRIDTYLTVAGSPADGSLRRYLGSTRIILVRSDGLSDEPGMPPDLSDDLRAAVRRLSPFRYGFTFAMACRQLGARPGEEMAPAECAALLAELAEVRLADGRPLLVWAQSNQYRARKAPPAFEMMLRSRELPEDDAERSELHGRAAIAVAPLLRPAAARAHVELATSLSAPWLDEALAQLGLARAAGVRAGSLREAVIGFRTDRLRLLRFSGLPVLERLPLISGAKGDEAVYQDYVRRLRSDHHPARHSRAATMAITLAQDEERERDERDAFARAAARHLADGTAACGALPTAEERAGAAFLIETTRCRLAWESPRSGRRDAIFLSRFAKLCRPSLELLNAMQEIHWSDWFERAGDAVSNHRAARRVYRRGLWNDKLPNGGGAGDRLLIKWLGTFAVADIVPRSDLERVRSHLDDRFRRAFREISRQNPDMPISTSVRWRNGLARLRRLLHRDVVAEKYRSSAREARN